MDVFIKQKFRSSNSPLKIIALDGKDISGNLKDHHVFVPFERYRKYDYADPSNQYKANISFKYNFEDLIEVPNYGYYWIDHLIEGEKLIVFPTDPIREGFIFDGWYTEAECINKADLDMFVKENTAEETIFYAKWAKF